MTELDLWMLENKELHKACVLTFVALRQLCADNSVF